jgi:hypothetical protein
VLELHRGGTTTSASQLEAHLQVAPEEQFQENHDINEHSTCQVADKIHDNVPDDTSPNVDAGVDVIPTFKDSMRIMMCPEVTVVDAEHTSHVKHAFYVHRMLCGKSSSTAC